MNRAQVQRADAQRRTLESRLQALQARVEPRFLLDTLAQVHALYERDPDQGSQMLGDLIVYLRAALPHLRDSTSTLEQELKLVGAYLGIMRVHSGGRLEFAIDASQPEFAARVPPMVLLPLVNHLLVDGLEASSAGSTIRIAARTRTEALCVELSARDRCLANGGSSASINDIRERLHALYGERGALACESSTTHGTRMMLEIPYEPADSGHR
jgi:LytS/YehU family sensor histidine kinase